MLEEQAKSGGKLILCTISTLSGGDAAFLRRLVAAVADRRDWTLFLGLGGTFDPVALGELPEHVHTFTYVPQLRVLRQADLSINHGGIHTIHECLHFGVPMLVYSGKQSDQPGCAARVHYHGLGLLADKDVDGAGAIARNIATVLEDPAYRQRVLAMRQSCQAYATARTLEKRLAEWLQMPTEQVIRP